MISIVAQQEFLPTNLTIEHEFWMYGFPIAVIAVGCLLFFLSPKNSALKIIGIIPLIMGNGMLLGTLTMGDRLDHDQNYENLKSNIQTVYDVDSVTLLDRSVENGDKIKIQSDSRTYEVFLGWDVETFEPKLSPINSIADDIEALKK